MARAAIAGWDLTYADHVRRHLDHEELVPGFREEFLRRAGERGVDAAAAEKTWDAVAQFASFGFCKAHAAAFAVPTYRSAWLKAPQANASTTTKVRMASRPRNLS